nr:uncharacterized protein LOC110078920 isoform X3 [Pogona vitticeps]
MLMYWDVKPKRHFAVMADDSAYHCGVSIRSAKQTSPAGHTPRAHGWVPRKRWPRGSPSEQQKWRKCIKGAFNVMNTTGSQKLQKKSTSFRFKLSDSGGRFWEELSIQPDCSMNSLHDRSYRRTSSPVIHLSEELPEDESPAFQMPATQVSPSTRRQQDIEMEPTHAFERANGNLCREAGLNLPQRLHKSSEPLHSFDAFAEALGLIPDSSLLMDVEPSETADLTPNALLALLPQPLLAESDGDVTMEDETTIRKTKEIPVLERVGETLRQKKLRATQA